MGFYVGVHIAGYIDFTTESVCNCPTSVLFSIHHAQQNWLARQAWAIFNPTFYHPSNALECGVLQHLVLMLVVI